MAGAKAKGQQEPSNENPNGRLFGDDADCHGLLPALITQLRIGFAAF
jgi:hypothetical protein